MAGVIGSEVVVLADGINPAAVNITVPSGCTRALVFWGWYTGGNGTGLASCTLDGQNPMSGGTFEVPSSNVGNGEPAGGVQAYANPAAGTRALDFNWDEDPGDGPVVTVVYLNDTGVAAWSDADGGNDDVGTAVAVTLNGLTVGDLVVAFDARFSGTPPPAMGGSWASVVTQTDQNGYSSRVSTIVATGATQLIEAQTESYTVLIAVSIPDAVAGAQTIEPAGLGSAAVYGSHTVTEVQLTPSPSGIASAAVFGSHIIGLENVITPSGVGTASVFGSQTVANVAQPVSPGSVTSAAVYGSHIVIDEEASEGIPSAAVFGSHTVATAGVDTITPNGLSSAAVYGNHTVSLPPDQVIAPSGQGSAAVYGTHTIADVLVNVQPSSTLTGARFGAHTIIGGVPQIQTDRVWNRSWRTLWDPTKPRVWGQ